MVEITEIRLEKIFQPMRALKFITGHVVLTWLIIKSYNWKPPTRVEVEFLASNFFTMVFNF